jgi:hypothetical protein
MRHSFLIAAMVLAPGAATFAQGEAEVQRSHDVSFHVLDADSDGRISKTEAAANEDLGRRFAVVDRDRDGFLDTLEYHQHVREMLDPRHQHPQDARRE